MIEGLLREHLRGHVAAEILEVGPGYSSFGRIAAEITGAQRLVLVDVDQAVLDWQLAQCSRTGLRAESLRLSLDVDDLERIPGSYDLVLCQEVLEHLPNAEQVLLELAKRLDAKGYIVITVPTKVSERIMHWLNPTYMKGQVHGHVRQFDERALRGMLAGAGLHPVVFIPTQPHYFVTHMWMHATRMKVAMATGSLRTKGLRFFIWSRLMYYLKRFFVFTGKERWGRVLPRNYFVVARKAS